MRTTDLFLAGIVAAASIAGCGESRPPKTATPPATTPAPATPTIAPKPAVLGHPAPPAAPAASPVPDGFVRVVNTHCPVQTDHTIKRGMVTQEYAVEHRGRMIGMCCGDCVDYWKNLSDDERDELVAKVTAPLASNPPAPK